jgi:hypothetical protein
VDAVVSVRRPRSAARQAAPLTVAESFERGGQMKRVLRTVVLSTCVASAVAFGGIYQDGGDGDGHTTRARQGPSPADLFRAKFGGGPTQNNDCDSRFAAFGSATGGSGGGSGGAPAMPFDRGTGSGQKCRNSRG